MEKGKKRDPHLKRDSIIFVCFMLGVSVYAHLSWNVFVDSYSMFTSAFTHHLSWIAELIGIILEIDKSNIFVSKAK